MSTLHFLELAASLSLQIAIVIGVSAWLVRQTDRSDTGHHLWGACHMMILAVTAAAMLLPHLRLIPHSIVTDRIPLSLVSSTEFPLGEILWAVWATGSLLYAVAMVVAAFGVRRLIVAAKPLKRRLDLDSGNITLLVSSQVTSPFCWQLQEPFIVLPKDAESFPDDELRAIIHHELAHLRSSHAVYLFLQRTVEMLYWFHPLVWWGSRQADLHREYHCDLEANRSATETASYLRSLLRLAECTTEMQHRLPAGLGFRGAPSSLQKRVERLMSSRRNQVADDGVRTTAVAAIAVVAGLATCVWLPIDVSASSRSVWSPWPRWSASALYEFGIAARDYEVDGYLQRPHEILEASAAAAEGRADPQPLREHTEKHTEKHPEGAIEKTGAETDEVAR